MTLVFFEKSHRYKLDGKWVPGVTTILGVLDKPAIPKWAAGQVAEYVADNPEAVEHLRNMGRGPMVSALKGLPWQKRDDAGTRGNILHDYAEALLKGEEVEVADEHVAVMEHVLDFMETWQIKPLLIEAPVASRKDKWAGTLDLIAEYVHPVTGHAGVLIGDWKSSAAIYPETSLQVNAYAGAEFAVVNGEEVPIPKCDMALGVRIGSDGYDAHPLEFGPHVYDEFVVIRQAFDIAKRVRGDYKIPGSGYVGLAIQGDAA